MPQFAADFDTVSVAIEPDGDGYSLTLTQDGLRPGYQTNHYSLLRTIEDLFGLEHLGYAGQSGIDAFGLDVFVAVP
jgi:hypothetical protein